MTTTPYDGKILLVNVKGRHTPGGSPAELAALIADKMPRVAGIMLRTSTGVSWEGDLRDSGPLAVTGVTRIRQWVEGFAMRGLEVHVWGIPRAKRPEGAAESDDLEKEADKFIHAATVNGVKSLLLDVQHGAEFWQGSPAEAKKLMTLIREGVGSEAHIGMILDGRQNRPFEDWVDPWIPFVDSLHPMVYPIWFSGPKTIEQHLDDAFGNLDRYEKPIVPTLQAFGEARRRPTPDEIVRQAYGAWARGAAGISIGRLGTDVWPTDGKPQMGEPEYAAIARIQRPREWPAPTYPWQSVINAAATVAARVDGTWQEWLGAAAFWRLFVKSLRDQPYSGPPIEHWPLPEDLRQQILELVVLEPNELRHVYNAALAEQQERHKEKRLAKRPNPGSIVGIHGAPGYVAPPRETWDAWVDRLKEMGIKWYKQCDNGAVDAVGPDSVFAWAEYLKKNEIEPIIRFMATHQFPRSLNEHHFEKMQLYAQKGIVWAEIGNEPNQTFEWSEHDWVKAKDGDRPRMHVDNPEAIRSVAEAWITDAKKALDAGVWPAFYAFSPTDWGSGGQNPHYSSVRYTRRVVRYLAEHHRAATIDAFERGAWIAVHAATYEQPVDFHPYRPNGNVWDMALRGYEVVLDAFRDSFGDALDVDQIPIMSTEGGVFTPKSSSMVARPEWRELSYEEHGKKVVEMFRWLEQHSPLQAMCPWCISFGSQIGGADLDPAYKDDGWFLEVNGEIEHLAVYDAMRQLRFDHQHEADTGVLKLDVPYISQWDQTAGKAASDCGPASLAMIVNADQTASKQVTVDDLSLRYLSHKLKDGLVVGFTQMHEMLDIGRGEGLDPKRVDYPNAEKALAELRELVRQGTPFVALVNYAKWDHIAKNEFKGGHFVVVTGFDDENVYVHDPLFGLYNPRDKGRFFIWRNQTFLDGWGGFPVTINPNFAAIVPKKTVGFV